MMYLSMLDAAYYIMYKRQLSDIITSYSKIIDILSKYRFRQDYVQIFGPKSYNTKMAMILKLNLNS